VGVLLRRPPRGARASQRGPGAAGGRRLWTPDAPVAGPRRVAPWVWATRSPGRSRPRATAEVARSASLEVAGRTGAHARLGALRTVPAADPDEDPSGANLSSPRAPFP
jgi:hypothetical protein